MAAATVTTVADTSTYQFLLAGDIGGTNSRMALYERTQYTILDPFRNSDSRYNRPLFAKEYRNEDRLGCDDRHGPDHDIPDDATGEKSRNRKNIENFVETIIGPFLEEAWNSDEVAGSRKGSNTNPNTKDVFIVCCLGVTGPVDPSLNDGTVTTSQRDYLKGLNGRGIVEECQTSEPTTNDRAVVLSFVRRCVVINDFVAQGYGCLSLTMASGELKLLNGNSGGGLNLTTDAPKFCVGAGTGFGSCYMVPSLIIHNSNAIETEYACFPSEYGQSDWAPNCDVDSWKKKELDDKNEDDQTKLWKYLKQQKQNIAVEHVVSGIGLATAYECLSGLFPEQANASVRAKFELERDLRGKVVGEHSGDCAICKRAVEMVLRAYGSAVGSCAMAFLPTGGLYVTGGLLLNLLKNDLEHLDSNIDTSKNYDGGGEALTSLSSQSSQPSPLSLFVKAYRSKGAASFLLNDIPLYVVLAKDTGLRGAAVRAEMEFKTCFDAITGKR